MIILVHRRTVLLIEAINTKYRLEQASKVLQWKILLLVLAIMIFRSQVLLTSKSAFAEDILRLLLWKPMLDIFDE
jgi:hypothetical protein